MATDTITFGVQSGDVPSGDATEPHFMPLRKLLAARCIGPYSPEIDEFPIVLRVSGQIWRFEGEGCQRLRLQRKKRYITIDIVMPENRWLGASAADIRTFLARMTEEAIELMIAKLEKSGVKVESEKLRADLRQVLAEYPSQPEWIRPKRKTEGQSGSSA
jgi:hypothetical protein